MTYDTYSSSVEENRPVELFTFVQGATIFRYTNQPADVTVASQVYASTTISRGRLEETRDSVVNNQVELTVPSSNTFATRFKANTPASRASIKVQRYQRSDTTPQVITIFEGFVSSVDFSQEGQVASIKCIPITQAQSRPIPRQGYQNACNHVLGDSLCKVDLTDARWRLSATATAFDASTNEVTVAGAGAFGADWWVGGVLEFGGGTDNRLIIAQSGDDLKLLLPFPNSVVGSTVVVLAGCDHSITTCDTKFNTPQDPQSNVINYGGFPFVPGKNPFETGL